MISLTLVLCLCLSLLAACGGETPANTGTVATTSVEATTEATVPAPTASAEAKAALDGKKIIFIGNSYTFYGKAVIYEGTNMTQNLRTGDQGLFYHLCKANGIDVEVTDWTFPGHDITDSMGHSCTTNENYDCYGMDHLSYLTDHYFDYVCIQPYFEGEYTGDMVSHLKPTMDLFREANPNVKFLLLVPHATYFRDFVWRNDFQALAAEGVTICNWGGMLDDLVNKRVQLPGSTQQCFFGTFVVSKDENDGHHQNLLGGYLTSLMVYCAITGESAVGQPYDFADDPSIHPNFDMEKFQKEYYTYEPFTNFVDIYRSESDMLGLQQLTDQYIAKFNEVN